MTAIWGVLRPLLELGLVDSSDLDAAAASSRRHDCLHGHAGRLQSLAGVRVRVRACACVRVD